MDKKDIRSGNNTYVLPGDNISPLYESNVITASKEKTKTNAPIISEEDVINGKKWVDSMHL